MKAIVTGISGQDGYYLARILLENDIQVIGLTTDIANARADYKDVPGEKITITNFDYSSPNEFRNLVDEINPDYVFNFAAKSTGAGMFSQPQEMKRLNGDFPFEILEAIRSSEHGKHITFIQASSSEMFGDVTVPVQDEATSFRPKSPYGAAKLYVHNMIGIYRKTFDMRCCSAILFNHESVRRSPQFVTRKITNAAARIKLNIDQGVELGALSIQRDWGYAPDYMKALFAMAREDEVTDYVVATGTLSTIQDVARIAFSHLDLDYKDYVTINPAWARPNETIGICGNPAKIERRLGWRNETPLKTILEEMVDHEMRSLEVQNQ